MKTKCVAYSFWMYSNCIWDFLFLFLYLDWSFHRSCWMELMFPWMASKWKCKPAQVAILFIQTWALWSQLTNMYDSSSIFFFFSASREKNWNGTNYLVLLLPFWNGSWAIECAVVQCVASSWSRPFHLTGGSSLAEHFGDSLSSADWPVSVQGCVNTDRLAVLGNCCIMTSIRHSSSSRK